MGRFVSVAKRADLEAGTSRVIEVNGKTIALFNVDGTFYAIDNTCLHRGGPLGEGFLSGCIVTCPWHGWEYDVATGKNLMNPVLAVACYPVRIEADDIHIEV